jgi:hypothetical protein
VVVGQTISLVRLRALPDDVSTHFILSIYTHYTTSKPRFHRALIGVYLGCHNLHLPWVLMSPVNSLWFKWKSLRLPWRRSFLVGRYPSTHYLFLPYLSVLRHLTSDAGTDLSGNTYWEFKDSLNAGRYRRIVKYNSKTHYADVQVTRECLKPSSPSRLVQVS